ncbi:MAG: aspartate kinase [Lentimonas sp.]|jgi:aspartate kinase
MKVFKFGGASVKDPSAVRNVSKILSLYKDEKIIVVVSAMGKTTNALELLCADFWAGNEAGFLKKTEDLRSFHSTILIELFPNKSDSIYDKLESTFKDIESTYTQPRTSYNQAYDQIVSFGEVISTQIVNAFLLKQNQSSTWLDARELVRTNHKFREAEIDWPTTKKLIKKKTNSSLLQNDILVTQGFIGHTSEGLSTTLGREGSDFTAGVFAFCTNAESVTIWKDVPGMLNADPKYFDDTIKLDRISFKEAIELSYYGASVIHPKTLKPLQNKKIPLYVKSFIDPAGAGTEISVESDQDHIIPSFIFKMNQILLSFTPRDFSFIVEENLSDIFNKLARANAKINLMQNSALSFSVLLDRDKIDLRQLIGLFENDYLMEINEELELVTIRHYDQKTIDRVCVSKEVLLTQETKETARLVLRPI